MGQNEPGEHVTSTSEHDEAVRRGGTIWAWGIGLAVVVALLACLLGTSLNSSDHSAGDAPRMCRDFVKAQLISPGSAKFSGTHTQRSGDEYTVTGSVDAQNAFGALLRRDYTCTIRDEGDTWRLVSLTGVS